MYIEKLAEAKLSRDSVKKFVTTGAKRGLLPGAVVGGLVNTGRAVLHNDESDEKNKKSLLGAAAKGAVAGGVGGAALGGAQQYGQTRKFNRIAKNHPGGSAATKQVDEWVRQGKVNKLKVR